MGITFRQIIQNGLTALVLGFLLLPVACREAQTESPVFVHDLPEGPWPWTDTEFGPGKSEFTFAIISDLNGGERPGVFRRAVKQLNRLGPDFVLSVGDLIDGGTEDTLVLREQWDFFEKRAGELEMPFFYLGGNHDLTNVRMREFWSERFGPRYYHFLYRDVLFLMLDSEDYTQRRMGEIYQARDTALRVIRGELGGKYEETTYFAMPERDHGAMGAEQLDYFEDVLRKYPDVRWTFVLMHKPLWKREGEKGLQPLENALRGRDYTVINGHYHKLSHRKRNGMDYIILGTTGGSQDPSDSTAFDHISLVRMDDPPVITHLKMDGILQADGSLPPMPGDAD